MNVLLIFKQDLVNLRQIYDQHVIGDMDFKQFLNLCQSCWEEKYGFLMIDKESEKNNGRYRKNFDNFAQL